jgi:hypothetical protein
VEREEVARIGSTESRALSVIVRTVKLTHQLTIGCMAPDEVPSEAPPEVADFTDDLTAQFKEDVQPYVNLTRDSLARLNTLIAVGMKSQPETAEAASDIFRAVVVLTHAYVEDFLRKVASVCLPNADEYGLNDVPLAGLGNKGRAEKFFLGKLTQHRGKTVDEVIQQSVSEYLEHRSFNDLSEIISFLEDLGFRPKNGDWDSDFAVRWREIAK